MKAYLLVTVAPGKVPPVIKNLRDLPEVKAADACWGLPDVFATIEVAHEDQLSQLVLERIQKIDGIEKTETHIVVPERWLL